jgi:hypothetical protein
LRVIIAAGKFQGVMMAQTPTASFIASTRRSRVGAGMSCPETRRPRRQTM